MNHGRWTCVYYCGKECQKKDWKTHKKVCASMAMGKTKTPINAFF